MGFVEQQAKMDSYSGKESAEDFFQIFLPMYFLVLFGMVSPLFSVGLALLTIATQLRVDAWKLLTGYRRVFPDRVGGIGITWNRIITALEFLCITTNILLMLTQLDIQSMVGFWPSLRLNLLERPILVKLLLFVILMNFFIAVRALLNYVISDEPDAVIREKDRQEWQRMKLGEKQTDELKRENITLRVIGGDQLSPAIGSARPLLPGDAMFQPSLF